jgi:hypothetical protein
MFGLLINWFELNFAWSNAIASHMPCRVAKRKLMVRKLSFWRPYIALCVHTYSVHCTHSSEIYRYEATRWVVQHSGRVSGFLTRRIWKCDAKTKTGNIHVDPLLTKHVYYQCLSLRRRWPWGWSIILQLGPSLRSCLHNQWLPARS